MSSTSRWVYVLWMPVFQPLARQRAYTPDKHSVTELHRVTIELAGTDIVKVCKYGHRLVTIQIFHLTNLKCLFLKLVYILHIRRTFTYIT